MFRLTFFVANLVIWINLNDLLGLGGNTRNVIEKLLILLAGLTLLATRKIRFGSVLIVALIVVSFFFAAWLSQFRGFSWLYFVSGLASMMAVFVLLLAEPNERDQLFVLKVLSFGATAMVLIGLAYQITGRAQIWSQGSTGEVRLGGSNIPAMLGAVAYVSSFSALLLSERTNQRRYYALCMLSLTILILSGARMALGVTILSCGYLFLRSRRLTAMTKGFVIVYFTIAVVVIGISFNILSRFGSSTLTGRDLILSTMHRVVHRYPWFGVGLGHSMLLVPHILLVKVNTVGMHDEYLRLAVECGYFGAAVFFILFAVFIVDTWLSPVVQRNMFFVVASVSVLIYCLTDNVFGRFAFLILSGAYCAGPPWQHEFTKISQREGKHGAHKNLRSETFEVA